MIQNLPHSSRILKTKLHIPQRHVKLISRPTLYKKLTNGLQEKLTLVSAPAGFGKSSLVSEWIRASDLTSGWVSLDKGDNDPARFWDYFVSAINRNKSGFGQDTLLLLHSVQNTATDTFIYTLIEEIELIEEETVIVLDDFHEITEPSIHQTLSILIQHLPNHVHIIMVTRSEPLFPLHQLRAKRQIVEIGMDDLRFNSEEVYQYFNEVMKLDLPLENARLIQERTEGWAAGIQLAALTMNRKQQTDAHQLSGNQRYIGGYLAAEVLNQHAPEVRLFLLKTALLKRMNSSLCEALTGLTNGYETLQLLVRTNSFIISLDHEQNWYRYHHLFADLLQTELKSKFPAEIKDLHRKASDWFAQNGFRIEAIEHALEGEYFERAATLINHEAPNLLKKAETNTILGWLKAFPAGWVDTNPMLCISRAWSLSILGNLEEAMQPLHAVEQQVIQDQALTVKQRDEIMAEMAVVRGYESLVKKEQRDMLRLFTESSQKQSNVSRFLEVGVDLNSFEALPLRGVLGFRGYLNKVNEVYPQLRKLFWNRGLAIVGYGAVIMSELLYERNDLEQAEYFLDRGLELGNQFSNIGVLVPIHITYARLKLARERDSAGAWEMIGQLEERISAAGYRSSSHWMNICQALKVQLWIQEGNRKEVYRWLRQCRVSISDAHTSHKEFEQFMKVRAWLSIGEAKEALVLLARLKTMTEKEDRLGSRIEALLLLALAHHMQMDTAEALANLEETLVLAKPEGYVRLFLDEGNGLLPLLAMYVRLKSETETRDSGGVLAYAKQLLKEMEATDQETDVVTVMAGLQSLTPREEEVVQLIEKGFTNKEIAYALELSEGTVKGYCNKIFAKLHVNNRTQAVARLRELKGIQS